MSSSVTHLPEQGRLPSEVKNGRKSLSKAGLQADSIFLDLASINHSQSTLTEKIENRFHDADGHERSQLNEDVQKYLGDHFLSQSVPHGKLQVVEPSKDEKNSLEDPIRERSVAICSSARKMKGELKSERFTSNTPEYHLQPVKDDKNPLFLIRGLSSSPGRRIAAVNSNIMKSSQRHIQKSTDDRNSRIRDKHSKKTERKSQEKSESSLRSNALSEPQRTATLMKSTESLDLRSASVRGSSSFLTVSRFQERKLEKSFRHVPPVGTYSPKDSMIRPRSCSPTLRAPMFRHHLVGADVEEEEIKFPIPLGQSQTDLSIRLHNERRKYQSLLPSSRPSGSESSPVANPDSSYPNLKESLLFDPRQDSHDTNSVLEDHRLHGNTSQSKKDPLTLSMSTRQGSRPGTAPFLSNSPGAGHVPLTKSAAPETFFFPVNERWTRSKTTRNVDFSLQPERTDQCFGSPPLQHELHYDASQVELKFKFKNKKTMLNMRTMIDREKATRNVEIALHRNNNEATLGRTSYPCFQRFDIARDPSPVKYASVPTPNLSRQLGRDQISPSSHSLTWQEPKIPLDVDSADRVRRTNRSAFIEFERQSNRPVHLENMLDVVYQPEYSMVEKRQGCFADFRRMTSRKTNFEKN